MIALIKIFDAAHATIVFQMKIIDARALFALQPDPGCRFALPWVIDI
jgi:hypothetical protein